MKVRRECKRGHVGGRECKERERENHKAGSASYNKLNLLTNIIKNQFNTSRDGNTQLFSCMNRKQ